METALYYTLSTVAQTLAGTLAILVAVMLAQTSRVTDAQHAGTAHPLHQASRRVRHRLRMAIGLSLVDIGVCFGALPFTPLIARHSGVAVLVLAVTIVLGVVCLVYYWRLIELLFSFRQKIRRQPSSATVQSFCLTFSHRLVGPLSYTLASSFAT